MVYVFTPQPAVTVQQPKVSSYVISERLRDEVIGRAIRRAKGWEFRPRRGSVLTAVDLGIVSRFMRELV